MKTTFTKIALAASMSVALVAGTSGVFAQTKLPPVSPKEVKGNIVMAGSSTVYPLAQKVAEEFKTDGYTDNITVDSVGSGAGITRFCRGEIDIANSSRAMTRKKSTSARANGRDSIRFRSASTR